MQARQAQTEQLRSGHAAASPDYWNARGRARRYAATVGGGTEQHPLFPRLRRATTRRSTVIDVGAGTGRVALPLAPRVESIVAVDSSRAMLGVLKRAARDRGIGNIRCVERRWEDVELAGPGGVGPADVVVCSFVLPLIAEAEPFLAKIDAACRGRAFVVMNAMSADGLVDPFWRHFHGGPRKPAPTYLDAVAIVADLGREPEVEVVEVRSSITFVDLKTAVRSYQDVLALDDTTEVRTRLRSLLSAWLVDDRGTLRPPIRTTPMAIVSWDGGAESEA